MNLITAGPTFTSHELSLGDPSGPGIAHNRHWVSNFWTHDYAVYISAGSYSLIVNIGATSYVFLNYGTGTYTPKYGDGTTLTLSGGQYTFTGRDGTVATFAQVSNATSTGYYITGVVLGLGSTISRPDGNVINLTYGTGAYGGWTFYRLISATNRYGFQIKYEYPVAAVNSRAWSAYSKATAINNAVDYCSPTAPSCSGFTQPWPTATYSRVTSGTTEWEYATDALGNTTTYVHSLAGNVDVIMSITYPGNAGSTVTIEYPAPANGYRTIYTGKNGVWSYYLGNGNTTEVSGPSGTVERTVAYNHFLGVVTSDTDALGRQTSYGIDGAGRVTQLTRPELDVDQFSYDARGNVTQLTRVPKPGSGATNIVASAGYDSSCANPKTCNLPGWERDGRGNQTDYTYNATHGGVLTVTAPADANGVRPQTRYTYVQRYAWIKSGSGYVQAASPIWLLESEEFCRTSAASGSSCAAGASDEVVTTYDYGPNSGPNNLWLRGKVVTADGVSLRTCYQRDSYGRVIAETSPNANLSSCS